MLSSIEVVEYTQSQGRYLEISVYDCTPRPTRELCSISLSDLSTTVDIILVTFFTLSMVCGGRSTGSRLRREGPQYDTVPGGLNLRLHTSAYDGVLPQCPLCPLLSRKSALI